MKTKLFLSGLLVIAIQVMVMGQIQMQKVLVTRVSKSVNTKPVKKNAVKEPIGELNERISDYDAQILALTRKKQELNSDINNFFEEGKQSQLADDEGEVRMAIASLESEINKSFEVYEKNNNTIKDIVITAVDKEVINDQLIDLVAEACRLATSAQLIKKEAYDVLELPARQGVLGNSLEKISTALTSQDKALQKLSKPASEKGVCYTQK